MSALVAKVRAALERAQSRPRARRALGSGLLLLLVVLAVLRSHLGTRNDGFTFDEPWHMVAGISSFRTGDYRLNPEHPPLVKLWVGALAPAHFELPPLTQLVDKLQERELVESIVFQKNDAAAAQRAARRAMWAFHAVLMFALGLLIWRALGFGWAIGTLAFLAIDPTVSAHMPVVMTDLPLGILLAIGAVCGGLLASTWSWAWAGATGLALGAALASKHSGVVGVFGIGLALTIAAIVADREHRGGKAMARRLGLVLAVTAVALLVLWATYRFSFHAGPAGVDAFNRPMAEKIADLNPGVWRDAIAFFDRHALLPRAYLWGLADTIRVGMQQDSDMIFFLGEQRFDNEALSIWPTLIAVKLPLALVAIALVGAVFVRPSRLSTAGRWALAAVLAACALHLFALMRGSSSYAGIRHAVPVVVGFGFLAGAAVAAARGRTWLTVAVGALFALAVAMTAREPRLWEYHNELVGGTDGAYRYFDNEGVYLGQGTPGVRDYYEREIAATGLPVYFFFWVFVEAEIKATPIRYRRLVESLEDQNLDGAVEGYFVFPMWMLDIRAQSGWYPDEALKDLTFVERLGNLGIWKGRFVRPQAHAAAMYGAVLDYVYKEKGTDFALVARRLEETVARLGPMSIHGGYLELGNAYLRLRDREGALRAFRHMLDSTTPPIPPAERDRLAEQVKRIEAASDLATVPLMPNFYLE